MATATSTGRAGTSREVAELVFGLMGRMRAHFEEQIADLELTPPQAMALKQLEEPVAMRELAGLLRCDASNITGIVDRLEERELVERRVDPADRRVKHLVLTAAGRRLRRQLQDRLYGQVPGVSNLTPSERRALCDLLRKLLGHSDPS